MRPKKSSRPSKTTQLGRPRKFGLGKYLAPSVRSTYEMSILEICQLQVKPNISQNDPSILKSLIEVRSSLRSKVTNTNSRFYQCIEDPSLIYIFGVWPTISAHHAFLESPQRSEILLPQEDLLNFKWIMHMPLPGMESLPLDAHVMSMARIFFKGGEDHTEYQKMMDKHRHKIVDATEPHKVAGGWRSDAEPGMQEALVFTGWSSKQAHEDFTLKAKEDPEYAKLGVLNDGMEVRHMRNMET